VEMDSAFRLQKTIHRAPAFVVSITWISVPHNFRAGYAFVQVWQGRVFPGNGYLDASAPSCLRIGIYMGIIVLRL
jgi:hypothetical protein